MFNNEMYKRQVELQKVLAHRYPLEKSLKHLIACTELAKEVYEVLDTYPWKLHREMKGVNRTELLEELVDVFKYFMNLLILHDVTPDEFQEAYDLKSTIVEKRLL